MNVGVLVGVFVGVWVGVLVGVNVGVLVGVFVGVFVGVGVGGTCTPKYRTVVPPDVTFADVDVGVVLIVNPDGLTIIVTPYAAGATDWQNGSLVLEKPLLTFTSAPVKTVSPLSNTPFPFKSLKTTTHKSPVGIGVFVGVLVGVGVGVRVGVFVGVSVGVFVGVLVGVLVGVGVGVGPRRVTVNSSLL